MDYNIKNISKKYGVNGLEDENKQDSIDMILGEHHQIAHRFDQNIEKEL